MRFGSAVKSRLEAGSSEGSPDLELERESQYSKRSEGLNTMKNNVSRMLLVSGASLLLAQAAGAAEIFVNANISTSTTWTADNVYRLVGQIYVLPGATLTIEPGTLIASRPADGGSLAVTRGARINAVGTQASPIIFTSTADVATWTKGNPKTGTWRAVCNEWGNLTVMGRGYISENVIAANTAAPNANNIGIMEGLLGGSATDPNTVYGGGNDEDDSGSLAYVSFRYGGKVIGLNNELNGLSLGGVGRETTINNMEIMNNIDDGIEIWGGTVNLNYVSIWNIGDDSLDVDQGWRGKAQFGLIVQGYSALPASNAQGSGVGDNMIEIDGAEQSDYQPLTTAVIYNFTCIGNPGDNATGSNGGDHGVAYRDNARVQIRNSVFMDMGERLVAIDNIDGDGGAGYGFNGTHTWAATWTTAYNTYPTVNAPANPSAFYKAQVNGNLNEIKDSVFFRNVNPAAYTEADTRGVRAAGNNNVTATASPIAGITRGAVVSANAGLLKVRPVTGLNPLATNDAATSVGSAPNDGFFVPANFRGAFSSSSHWLCSWTAADAFGFITAPAKSCTVAAPCITDIDGDGTTGASDLAELLAGWGTKTPDLDNDGTVGASDLALLLGAWGNCQ